MVAWASAGSSQNPAFEDLFSNSPICAPIWARSKMIPQIGESGLQGFEIAHGVLEHKITSFLRALVYPMVRCPFDDQSGLIEAILRFHAIMSTHVFLCGRMQSLSRLAAEGWWGDPFARRIEMTSLETAEELVTKLSPEELSKFRRWFAEFDGEAWDSQMDADAAAGRLDKLAQEALAEYQAGKATEIRGT